MELNQLNFAQPLWLWGGILIPIVWILFFLFHKSSLPSHQLQKFIDTHLLQYLLVNKPVGKSSYFKSLMFWSFVWACLILSLAGPRWSFKEMETFSRDQSLVVLLDLSESMNAIDVKPSRLVRAKQKIEDLLNMSKGVKIGLIAFAADPHMIAPITDDKETIRHLLPSLDTSLAYMQGSRLASTLDMAATMLSAEPGNNKAILVISDGGFEDAGAISTAKKISEAGIVIHTMGLGTPEGAPLMDHEGNVLKKNGTAVLSKLDKDRLGEISKAGKGRYLDGHYATQDEAMILQDLEQRADAQLQIGKKSRLWDERFYLLILPVLPIVLWWFRRGYVLAMVLMLCMPILDIDAGEVQDYFKNSEQRGKQALEEGDYEKAVDSFQDPYRKGVSYYKSGKYEDAEQMFRQSFREEVAHHAAYNLGNTYVQQQKYKEAIESYEDALKLCPDHIKAKENLELVKKFLEQQQQQQQDESKEDDSEQDENKDKDQKNNSSKNQNQKGSNKDDQKDKQNSEKENSDQGNDDQQEDSKNSKKGNQQQENNRDKQNRQKNDKDSQDKQNGDDKDRKHKQDEHKEHNDRKDQQDASDESVDAAAAARENAENKATGSAKESAADMKTQADLDADLWLNRLNNDPKKFLKNKFYMESKNSGTTEGVDPW